MTTRTLGSVMSSVKGFTSGFDYLRLILSISVLAWHSVKVTQGQEAAENLSRAWAANLTYPILPMFFALSGFLVASSLQRTPSLPKFLWLRAIRLVPALMVEVTVSALILGPLVTDLPWREYFLGDEFRTYFLNVIGWIHYKLPGVFGGNPYPRIVNFSLWTVPFELECYLTLSVLAIATLTKRPRLLLGLFLVATIAKAVSTYFGEVAVNVPSTIGGRQLILFFLAGVLLNLNRAWIPANRAMFIGAVVLGFVMLRNDHLVYLAALPLAYATAWLGLLQPPRNKILLSGDYSYGIYLYAAPVQQTVWWLTDWGRNYTGNLLLSLLAVSLFAAFSWHFIEKPTLRLKTLFTGRPAERPVAQA